MISVIVPVYNVEAYLPECMSSILSQSYRDLEIILIDDGSTDGSGILCDEYAARDSRVKVIHQKNGGAANAKNAGLRIARGEFLSFVDSDDYLEPGAYEFMLHEMAEAQADVVQGSFRDVYRNKSTDRIKLPHRCEFDTVTYLKRYTRDWTCSLLWDKLYKRELFDGIFFEEGHIIDDEFFTYQGIMNAGKILHVPEIVYNYRKRASSVTQLKGDRQKIFLDKVHSLKSRRERIVKHFPQLKQEFDSSYLERLLAINMKQAESKEVVSLSQGCVREYFTHNIPCKMSPAMFFKLMEFIHTNPERWLRRYAAQREKIVYENIFFE